LTIPTPIHLRIDVSGAAASGYVLPVTLGCDCRFVVRRINQYGWAWDYHPSPAIYLDIEANTQTVRLPATTVEANIATFTVPSTVADRVRTGSTWQAILSLPDATVPDQMVQTPLIVGTFERFVGGAR
jgi:hypothetical protein